jgi:hypothetical protein
VRTLVVTTLVLALIGGPVAAAQSVLSFAVELSAGTVAAAVPFYAALFSTSDALRASRLTQPSAEDVIPGLALPPLAAGAAVGCAGSLFGVTGPLAVPVAVLGALVSEIFAVQVWQLDVPGWVKTIAVPVVTSLGATLAFNRLARCP